MLVADLVRLLEQRYPPEWAEDWDRVGFVLGEPDATVSRVLLAVDCAPAVVDEAAQAGAEFVFTHHPLLLRGVSSVAPTTYKGRIVHRMIRSGMALYTAHTNGDVARPGVSDALAARIGLEEVHPLRPDPKAPERGHGRIGRLPEPMTLARFARHVAHQLPKSAASVRLAGDPTARVERVAVSGGAGDAFLADAARAGVDAYLTADLRHHPAQEHLANGGPALVDVTHWASERPWLDDVAAFLRAEAGVQTIVSDVDTSPWVLWEDNDS
ncbi:Nif3-like dinuclear metal center hexameric protein [Dactylosporangium matsuzakiense]|uniref:GTP cyclohydrolase 1 type 2 homolog n=1 Tax=Dactylosporangium matsuzakiense TaxID=53360 RepID=A0A9W6KK62_9ACTN|nr:Nif3-like dinuclear metal center hexameric protein [Dactylosporangium matsuzakiense]UWZ43508.1 Nif3-like dinuclear metal center hexameric protein [Dactylosporangium matsuzakiense]GLL03008.1 GTP cyclohydrolase 1 type 2 [Dactylosporangium matsuzakiense]